MQHRLALSWLSRPALTLAVASGSLATSSVAWAQLTHNQQTQSVFVYTEGDGVDLYPSNNGPAVGGTWSKSDVRRSEVGDLGPFSAAVSVSGSAPGGNSGRASATIESVLAADAIVRFVFRMKSDGGPALTTAATGWSST